MRQSRPDIVFAAIQTIARLAAPTDIAQNADGTVDADNSGDVSAGQGAAVGAVWGGLVGLAALLIPGVGPFIAFGALGAP